MSKGYAGISSAHQIVTEDYDSLPNRLSFKRITEIKVNRPLSGMKLITVDVYWDNDNRRVRLQSILSKPGPD
jgi:hypothetical protein